MQASRCLHGRPNEADEWHCRRGRQRLILNCADLSYQLAGALQIQLSGGSSQTRFGF
jgi:hypothetical protein